MSRDEDWSLENHISALYSVTCLFWWPGAVTVSQPFVNKVSIKHSRVHSEATAMSVPLHLTKAPYSKTVVIMNIRKNTHLAQKQFIQYLTIILLELLKNVLETIIQKISESIFLLLHYYRDNRTINHMLGAAFECGVSF